MEHLNARAPEKHGPAAAHPVTTFDDDHRIAIDPGPPMNLEVPAPSQVFVVSASDGCALTVRRHGNPAGPRFVLRAAGR